MEKLVCPYSGMNVHYPEEIIKKSQKIECMLIEIINATDTTIQSHNDTLTGPFDHMYNFKFNSTLQIDAKYPDAYPKSFTAEYLIKNTTNSEKLSFTYSLVDNLKQGKLSDLDIAHIQKVLGIKPASGDL